VARVLAAISTPFGAGGDVDIEAFGAHVAWLREAGLDGVFVAGTTGEGVLLEEREVVALAERALAEAGEMSVIAQIGRPSTRATVELAGSALGLGVAGVAAYVPWFYPATDDDVRRHFGALLEAVDGTPAYLYNIPRRTVNDLAPALAGELAQAGYAGMKDSTADFGRHEEYLRAVAGTGFELFVGAEALVLRSLRAGSAGAITGLAGCRPELFATLRDAHAAGDDASAEAAQERIASGRAEIDAEGSTVAGVKRRVRERMAERGVDYPEAPRAPFA
jgi:4-hydroxy-tetrahydrodipicolinate synthase